MRSTSTDRIRSKLPELRSKGYLFALFVAAALVLLFVMGLIVIDLMANAAFH